jgi:transcriptional regulator with XRE-family HTH domain
MPTNFRGLQDRLRERLLSQIAAGELTGNDLARRTGFQQAHISNFLNSKRGLSLEAMDVILRVIQLPLSELLPEIRTNYPRKRVTGAESATMLAIPLVDESNCTALQVPNSNPRDSIFVAPRLVQNLPPCMPIPRPHWDRFVAWKVTASDAEAMSPRLERGSVAVIDRHHNSLDSSTRKRSMYLVNCHGVHVRYAECTECKVVLRPHNTNLPLMFTDHSAIVGRVCLVMAVV